MFKSLLRASLLLAPAVTAIAATPSADLDELHQRQFRYARAMMQLNQIEGFERGPSIDALLRQEREAKAERAEQGWRDADDARTQLMDAFAQAVERVATEQRAKRTMSRQWRIDEPYPSHWSVSGNEAAAADCARAIEHPLGQPLRIEMNRDGVAWLRVVAPGKGYWAFDTLVSEFDTKLSVYRDCRDLGAESKQISDDTVGLGAIVGLDAKTAGQTFLIKLERKGGVGSLAIAKSVLAGSISGRVTRASDGAPVNGAHVTLIPVDGSGGWTQYSAPDGRYQIAIYDDQEYYVSVYPGYQGDNIKTHLRTIYPSAVCASTNGSYQLAFCDGTMTAIDLAENTQIEGVDVVLVRSSTLAGAVLDDFSGEPVVGASIMVVAADDTTEQYTRRWGETDDIGRYLIEGLPQRAWRVQFAHPEYGGKRWDNIDCQPISGCDPGVGNEVVTSAANVANASAQLRASPYFSVEVSVNEAPADFPFVTLYTQNGSLISHYDRSEADPVGSVKVGPLSPGLYRAVVGADRTFKSVIGGSDCRTDCQQELLSGQILIVGGTPIKYTASLKPFPDLNGRVVRQDGGGGIAGVTVELFSVAINSPTQSTQTDIDGYYRFNGVRPATRYIHFRSHGFQDELYNNIPCENYDRLTDCAPGVALVFDYESPADRTVNAALERSASISGSVRQIGVTGSTHNQMTLSRLGLSGELLWSNHQYISNGNYVFYDAPPGDYYWMMKGADYYHQIFDGVNCGNDYDYDYTNCPLANAEIVRTLTGISRSGVDFEMAPEYSRLVKVLDAESGSPIAGVAIDQWGLSGYWIRSSITDAQGLAAVKRNLDVGQAAYYAVKLSTDSLGRYIDEVYDDQSCPTGTSVYSGGCSLAGAWTVPVSDGGSTPFPPLVIRLRSADPIFESGFE